MDVNDLTDFATCQLAFGCHSDTENRILQLITAASLWANKYTDRLLKARILTEHYDGDNSTILFLRNYPINSITSIHQDSDRVFGADTLIDPTHYVYSGRKLVGVEVVWWYGVQTIKVIYDMGYDLPTHGHQTYNRTTDPTTSAAQAYTFTLTIDGTASDGDLSVTLLLNDNFANIVTAIEAAIAGDANIAGLATVAIDSDHKIRVTSVSTGVTSTVLLGEPGAGTSLTTILTSIDAAVGGAAAIRVVPSDIENAILILVDFWDQSFDAHRFGVKSVGVMDQRIAYELGIPKQVKEMLLPYVKRVVL